jgi:hypothetical protein
MSILSSTKTGKRGLCTLFPENKYQLFDMIMCEILEKGNNCSLNHIDTSKITDMSYLFSRGRLLLFDGDISMWDVSNVQDMSHMFEDSAYSGIHGGIEEWNTRNLSNAVNMFLNSNCKCDLYNWNINKLVYFTEMFYKSNIYRVPKYFYKKIL